MAEKVGAKKGKVDRQSSIQSTRGTKATKKATSTRIRENSVQSTRDITAKPKKTIKRPARGM